MDIKEIVAGEIRVDGSYANIWEILDVMMQEADSRTVRLALAQALAQALEKRANIGRTYLHTKDGTVDGYESEDDLEWSLLSLEAVSFPVRISTLDAPRQRSKRAK